MEERSELLTGIRARALARLLDLPEPGTELPPLWHWCYLLDDPAMDELGADGHSRHGLDGPPEPGMRRMVAGGRVHNAGPLLMGQHATRRSRLLDRTDKEGRSGPLVFVTIRDEYWQAGRLAIVDDRSLVFRPPASGADAPANRKHPPRDAIVHRPGAPGDRMLAADERLLFRFSALTYNAYRAHYDLAFCQRQGFRGLLVHGPLQALLMSEQLRAQGARMWPSDFEYRLVAPLLAPCALTVHAEDGEARVCGPDGTRTAVAWLGRRG